MTDFPHLDPRLYDLAGDVLMETCPQGEQEGLARIGKMGRCVRLTHALGRVAHS